MAGKGGRAPYRQGYEYEVEVVKWLQKMGLADAKRNPMSGAIRGMPQDIVFTLPGMGEQRVECKLKGSANDRTLTLQRMMGDADLLITRRKGNTKDQFLFMRGIWFEKLVRILLHQHETLKKDLTQGDSVETLIDNLRQVLKQ